ncbi:MAG: hypothetical protein IKM04_06450 [Clostridia bacterium]|nr:hypothetical protein [Clostridia bacterium]
MGDIFNEQLVKKIPDFKDLLKKVGLGILGIAAMTFGMLYAGVLVLLIIIGVGVGIYFAYKEFDVEYEYVLTNDSVDIDKIIARERRKSLISDLSLDDVEVLFPMDEAHASDTARYARLKKIDASSSPRSPKRWLMVYKTEGQSAALIFEPNEKFIEGIRAQIPRKFKK